MSLQVIDKDGDWYINTAAFRLPDAETGHIFESGTKYKIKQSEWMKGQPMIKLTTVEEEVEVLVPHQPGDLQIGTKVEDPAPEPEAPAKKK